MGMTFVLFIMAIIYLPILLLVYSSFGEGWTYYRQLFTTSEYMQAVGNTLLIAIVASLIATIIAAMAATGILYMTKRTRAITMAVNQLPVINADIVTSFGLVLLFVSIGMTNLGLLKLLLAHVLIALPFCLLTILPKMRQLDANLIDAALDLGASPIKAFTSVIIPQLVPAMVQAFLLGFTLSLDDFVITQYNNSGVATISTVVYGAISRRDIPNAFKALTTIIFLVILVVLIVMNLNAARIRKGIKISRKITATVLAVVILAATCGVVPVIVSHLTPRTMVLKIYNWEDYIATGADSMDYGTGDLLADFEEYYRGILTEQGVKNAKDFRIEYHTFTDNEELYSKISTQHADYDLIFPSEYMVEKMRDEKLIQPMEVSKFMKFNNDDETEITLDENILERTKAFTEVKDENDNVIDGQIWAVPYMVGTVGIMYDINVINTMAEKENTGITAEDFEDLLTKYGFGVLFGEGGTDVYKGRITMKKSARDSIGTAMIYAAQKPGELIENAIYNNQFDEDGEFDNSILSDIFNMDGDYNINMAREVLVKQIRTMNPVYENDNGKKSFMNPDDDSFAYGLFWSCDAGLAMMELDDENADNEDYENPLRFYAPKGTNLWTDNFAIPTYAQNLDAAYAFINFMLNDENAARNIDYVGSQMVATGDAIDELKADYGVPGYESDEEDDEEEIAEIETTEDETDDEITADDENSKDEDLTDIDLFDAETNLAVTIFPTEDNITYSAIMHNFDKNKEKSVNNLMLEIQNKAAKSTEKENPSVNLFAIALGILALIGLSSWSIYMLTHRRPRQTPVAQPNDK